MSITPESSSFSQPDIYICASYEAGGGAGAGDGPLSPPARSGRNWHTYNSTLCVDIRYKYSVQLRITKIVTSGRENGTDAPHTKHRRDSITIPCPCAATCISGKTAWWFMNKQNTAFGETIYFQLKRYLFSLHKTFMNSGSVHLLISLMSAPLLGVVLFCRYVHKHTSCTSYGVVWSL